MIPSRYQWKRWTLISKATYFAAICSVLGILIPLVIWVIQDSDESAEASLRTERRLEEVGELLVAQRVKVTVIGDLGVTVHYAKFIKQLGDLGFNVQVTKADPMALLSGRGMMYPPDLQSAADIVARVLPPPFHAEVNPNATGITIVIGPDRNELILVSTSVRTPRADLVMTTLKRSGMATTFVPAPECQVSNLLLRREDVEWGNEIKSLLVPILPTLSIEVSDYPLLHEYRAILCLNSD